MNRTESMRRDWDARAVKDAFFYIASWRKDWDVSEFFKSGEEDYERLVQPVLNRLGFSPAGKKMVELGCGAGRMTRVFAARFAHVTALDISSEMLNRGRQLLPQLENVEWRLANGSDLRGIPSNLADFVFSYLVLQHLPDEILVRHYIREMLRIANGSGICLLQFNGAMKPSMNWKGTLAWRLIDASWAMHLPALSRWVARLLGFDPEMAGKSWRGAQMTTQRVADAVTDAGGVVIEFSGESTPMAWCCSRKVRASA
jgi:ubiquinone/menaquinone biosynthesis C-methylase UbiE